MDSITLFICIEIGKEIANGFSKFYSFLNQCQKDMTHKILTPFYWHGQEYEHYCFSSSGISSY